MAPILTLFLAASATQSATSLKQRPDEGDSIRTPAECKKCSTPHFLTRQDNVLQDPHRITLENHSEQEIVTLPRVTRIPQLGHQMHHREDETAQSHVLHRTNRREFAQVHITPSRSQLITVSSWLLSTGTWAARKLRPSILH